MKPLFYIVFLFPLYVIFNNIVFNITGIPFSDYYIYIKGHICKIEVFSSDLRYHFFVFLLLRALLLVIGFLYVARVQKIVFAFAIFDALAIFSWLIDNGTGTNYYSLFSSIQSISYLSSYLSGSPILLYITQSALLLTVILYGREKGYFLQNNRILLYSLGSAALFQLSFTFYHLLAWFYWLIFRLI